jgi:hypothetical protein
VDHHALELAVDQWATDVLCAFNLAGCWASASIFNNETGRLPPSDGAIPEAHRALFYRIRARVVRLEQLMEKLQKTPSSCP